MRPNPAGTVSAFPCRQDAQAPDATLAADLRYRALVDEAHWRTLPEAVQRRFSKRLEPGEMLCYPGVVEVTRLSRAGCWLAWFARAIGGPLPWPDGATGPATVLVGEAPGLCGQTWTRIYSRAGAFPQVVNSTKRFGGATGLEEHIGCGIAIELEIAVEDGALVFRSARYLLAWGESRVPLPKLLSPGWMEVVHRDLGGGEFLFELTLTHPALGPLVYQRARYQDATTPRPACADDSGLAFDLAEADCAR